MAYTSIISEETSSEIDGVNAVLIFLGTLISGIVLAFYGPNNSNPALGQMGLLFAVLSLVGVYLVEKIGGSYFKNGMTLEESNFAFWTPIILINIGGMFSSLGSTFSAISSPPGKVYAAGALAGEPESIKTFVQVFMLSQGENLAFFGIGLIFVMIMAQRYGKSLPVLMVSLIPLGLGFAGIHTEQLANIGFAASAFGLMYIMGLFLFGSDMGVDLPFKDVFLFSIPFFGGVHFGLNSSNTHGLIDVFFGTPEGILNIPDDGLQKLAIGISVLYLISLFYFVKYVYLKILAWLG